MDGDLGKMIRDAFPAKGLYMTEAVYDAGFRHFTSSAKPIRSAADLQGLKLRIPISKLYVDTFRSLGAAPATVVGGQLYAALQTHLVDAQETPLLFIESQHIYEVQKYCSLSHHMWTSYWIVFNLDKWQSLPRNLQEIARKHLNAGALVERRDSVALETSLRDKLRRQGLTIVENVDVASFKSKLATSDFYSRWKNEYGATAWGTLEKYSGKLA
jgi:TRAP-type C4-dicarboxylate transport system substrate-binding protein